MTKPEIVLQLLARLSIGAFAVLIFVTFVSAYVWLHPVLWTGELFCFVLLEGLLYVLKGDRTPAARAVTIALWTSIAAWFSLENGLVLMSVITVMRLLPGGWPSRIGSLLMAAGIGSLISFADLNPWSEGPNDPKLHLYFTATCILNMILVLGQGWLIPKNARLAVIPR